MLSKESVLKGLSVVSILGLGGIALNQGLIVDKLMSGPEKAQDKVAKLGYGSPEVSQTNTWSQLDILRGEAPDCRRLEVAEYTVEAATPSGTVDVTVCVNILGGTAVRGITQSS